MHFFLRIYLFLLLCYFVAPPMLVAQCKMHESSHVKMSCCQTIPSTKKQKKSCCENRSHQSSHSSSKKSHRSACDGMSCMSVQVVNVSPAVQKPFYTYLPKPREVVLSRMSYFQNDTNFPLGAFTVVEQPPKIYIQ